jgi:nitrile hydratase accessory protein
VSVDHDADGHHHDPAEELAFLDHHACVTDTARPTFEHEWQRRAFGVAVALSEFGHYPWEAFQQALIDHIGAWERVAASSGAPASTAGGWEYYEHWLAALERVVVDHGVVADGEVAGGIGVLRVGGEVAPSTPGPR